VKSALAERIAEIPLVINHVTPRTMPGSSTEIASEGSHGSVSSKPGDIVPSGSSALPAVSSQERRQDAARRKHTEEMSPDELRRELLTDSLTGLGNRRAYEESEKKPVQGVVDIDSLKYVNDNLGHEAGDKIIEATGRALRESGVEAYRIGGDEFAIQSHDHAALDRALTEASNRLANAEVVAELPDGTTITKKGVNFTHGIGPDRTQADLALNRAKAEREAQGLRAARGETPRGLTRTAARVQDQGNPVAAAQEEVSHGENTAVSEQARGVLPQRADEGAAASVARGAQPSEARGASGGERISSSTSRPHPERTAAATQEVTKHQATSGLAGLQPAAETPPKGGVSVSAPRTIDFESFAAERNAGRQDFGEPALSKNISGAEKDRAVRRQAERDRILQGSRERLRAEYDKLVAEGKINPPTSAEQLRETAAGHPDNPSTKAAQRALAKRAERVASQKTEGAPTDRDKRLVPVSKRADTAEKTAAEDSARAAAKVKFSLNKTESAVNKLNELLAKQNGEAWRNAYVRSELDKSQSRLAQAFKAAFGTDIVGIKPTDKRFADVGAMHVGGVTYINTEFKEHGFVQLAGHELLHQIRRERPNIYDWFAANAQNYLKKGAEESYRSRLEKAGADMRSTDVREEILADFVGDSLADREFLDHLASRNKTKFRMLVDYVVKWLNKTAQKLKMAGFGSSQYFTDVRGLQGYLSGVLDAYRSDAATGSESVKFSRSLGKESTTPEARIIGDSGRDYTKAQREAMARTGSTVTKRTIADTIKSIRQNARQEPGPGHRRSVRAGQRHQHRCVQVAETVEGSHRRLRSFHAPRQTEPERRGLRRRYLRWRDAARLHPARQRNDGLPTLDRRQPCRTAHGRRQGTSLHASRHRGFQVA
jgi:diguanylate cyclase (GGDEF)-like protein